jgi:hypothetical protein
MRPVHALQSMRHARLRFETVPKPEGTYSWHWTHWPGYRLIIGFDGLDALDWRLKTRCKPRFRMAWHVALTHNKSRGIGLCFAFRGQADDHAFRI